MHRLAQPIDLERAGELDLEAATEFLIGKGYDPALGARPLRRTVERFLEDPLAEELLRGVLAEGVIEAGVADDKQGLTFRMRDELPLRTPQPGEVTVRTAADEPAEKEGAAGEKTAAKTKKRPKRVKKQDK